jgi:hypothetical protein
LDQRFGALAPRDVDGASERCLRLVRRRGRSNESHAMQPVPLSQMQAGAGSDTFVGHRGRPRALLRSGRAAAKHPRASPPKASLRVQRPIGVDADSYLVDRFCTPPAGYGPSVRNRRMAERELEVVL